MVDCIEQIKDVLVFESNDARLIYIFHKVNK